MTYMKIRVIIALLCSISLVHVACQTTTSLTTEIDALINSYVDNYEFNGNVLMAHKGEVIFKKGYGYASEEWKIKNTPDTKFRIASASKQFTAMLVMQLVSEGRLELHTPIAHYLPTYPADVANKVTIHHLLTHSSGIPSYTNRGDYQEFMKNPIAPEDLVLTFQDSTLLFDPGERFDYSNSGYALLGYILEEVTGKSYGYLLKEKIFEPLGMSDSGYNSNNSVLDRNASGYYRNGPLLTRSNHIEMSVAYSAGGIHSTAEDLFLWDQALYTEKLLPKKWLDTIFTEQIPAWGNQYGYGWVLGNFSIGNAGMRRQVIEHDGVINGYRSLILRIPETRSTIILLHNNGSCPVYRIASDLTAIIYKEPYDLPRPSLVHHVTRILMSDGKDKAEDLFEKNINNGNYKVNETEFNMNARSLIQQGEYMLASDLLEMGLSQFPQSSMLYNRYGTLYFEQGKTEKSIEAFTRALESNPKDMHSLEMLSKLGVNKTSEDFFLLSSEKNWTKEVFLFPLRFAPDVDYQGKEEAYFPPGWRVEESEEFWSYVIAWHVESPEEQSSEELEREIEKYFDGLMKAVNKKRDFKVPSTKVDLVAEDNEGSVSHYSGKLELYDSFVKEEMFTLHAEIEYHPCSFDQQSTIIIRLSPSSRNSDIWKTLNQVKLKPGLCIR